MILILILIFTELSFSSKTNILYLLHCAAVLVPLQAELSLAALTYLKVK